VHRRRLAAHRRGRRGSRPRVSPGGPSASGHAQPAQPNRIDQHHTSGGAGRRMARPSSVCPAWVGERCKHGCADAQWQTPRRRRRTDGAGLRRHPNLRRGRLHRPALPIQPRSALRDPPRVGPAAGNSAAATPALNCRDRSSAQHGHSPDCVHPPARPRSWVTAQVGCWGTVARLVVVGLLGRRACATSRVEAPTAAATRGRVADRVKVAP
jgi:hypothetical protein